MLPSGLTTRTAGQLIQEPRLAVHRRQLLTRASERQQCQWGGDMPSNASSDRPRRFHGFVLPPKSRCGSAGLSPGELRLPHNVLQTAGSRALGRPIRATRQAPPRSATLQAGASQQEALVDQALPRDVADGELVPNEPHAQIEHVGDKHSHLPGRFGGSTRGRNRPGAGAC